MIALFEDLLRIVLTPALVDPADAASPAASPDNIFFVPPNEPWRTFVNTQDIQRLNVYLVDLRENRKRRSSNPRHPARLDCHYVISVWRQREQLVAPMPNTSYTREESRVLYRAAASILASSPMVPATVLGLAPGVSGAWGEFARHELPVTVAPPEGFPKIPEFWGTFGSEQSWKPIVHIIATLPIVLPLAPEGPPVTTIVSDYETTPNDTLETIIIIGGLVRVDGQPTEDVRVTLLRAGDRVRATTTDRGGHFSMQGLAAGAYQLQAQLGARNSARDIQIPSPFGRYELDIK